MSRFLRFLIYAALATPLLLFDSVFFPYVTSKMFVFEGLAIFAGITSLYLWYRSPRDYQPRLTPLGLTIITFVLVSLVAALFGIHFWRSFWSTYERMDGIFTWICLLLFFFALHISLQQEKDWFWFLRASLGVSLIVTLQALQFFGIFGQELTVPTRLSAVFNSPIYLGIYALFHTFIALLLLCLSGYTLQKSQVLSILGGWRFFYFLGLLSNGVVLFLTFSRGPIVGFAVGLLVSLSWYFLYGKDRKTALWGVSFFILLLALSFPLWGKSSLANRLGSVANGLGADETRVINWGVALKAFAARPLLGWGSNNFFFVQNNFFNPRLLLLTKEGFDRTHNKYLEVAVDSGLLGIISYLSIFALAFYFLFKRRHEQPFTTALLGGLFVAYLAQNMTAFDNPGSYLPLFLALAFVDAQFVPPLAREYKLAPSVFIISIFLLSGLLWRGIWQPYQENLSLSQALIRQIAPQKNYQRILAYYQDALSYGTFGDYETRLRLVMFAANDPQIPKESVSFAISEVKKELEITQYDVFLHFALAKLYERAAFLEDKTDVKSSLAKSAGEYYLKAMALAPTRTDSYEYYVIFLINQNQGQQARDVLLKIKTISPERFASEQVQWYWGMTYFVEGKFEQAYEEFQKVLARKETFPSAQEYLILGQTSYKLQKYPEMVHWYEELYRADTQNSQYCINLALAYQLVGNKEKAIDFAWRAMDLDPRLTAQAQAFIRSIGSSLVRPKNYSFSVNPH